MIKKIILHSFDSIANRPRIKPRILEWQVINSFIRAHSWTVFTFLTTILLVSCASPTPQATIIPQTSEVSKTSEVLTPTPTQTPALMPTSTITPETWRGDLIQEQYWLNPDGTTKPGEVIPAGCLQAEGKDHCVLNPEASPAVYEGLLKMIYNVTVSFGGNPGGYWDKSGGWAEREARLPQAAEEFVQACREGQTFDNLTNLVRWGGKRPSEGGGASMGLVYAEPFGTTIDCRNIQVVILTPEEMRVGWAQDELQGFWSTNGDMWYAKFETVSMEDGSGNSRIQFVIGRLEDKSDIMSHGRLKPGVTPESLFANMGIFRLMTALDPENGTLSIRSATHDVKKKTISLWGQTINTDPKLKGLRQEEAFVDYFNEYWNGGLVEGE